MTEKRISLAEIRAHGQPIRQIRYFYYCNMNGKYEVKRCRLVIPRQISMQANIDVDTMVDIL